MAKGRIIVGTRSPRELVVAAQYSGSDRIRTLTFSYRRLGQLFFAFSGLLLVGFYLLVVQATDAVEYDDGGTLEIARDPEWRELRAEIAGLIERTEELNHRQVWIGRAIVQALDHSDFLDYRENAASSLNEVHTAAPEDAFLPFRYIGRRLSVNLPVLEDNARYGDFYRVNFHGLPHRAPLLTKLAVSSGYGLRRRPYIGYSGGNWEFHRGLDIPARQGTPVFAAARGVVTIARHGSDGYGNVVVLDHPKKYRTLYGHMKRMFVRGGQFVRAGEMIGEVGTTGNSTGPHLHYEVLKDGHTLNPQELLAR